MDWRWLYKAGQHLIWLDGFLRDVIVDKFPESRAEEVGHYLPPFLPLSVGAVVLAFNLVKLFRWLRPKKTDTDRRIEDLTRAVEALARRNAADAPPLSPEALARRNAAIRDLASSRTPTDTEAVREIEAGDIDAAIA